jgi:hypothetical protein
MEDKEIDFMEHEDIATSLQRIKEIGVRHDREDADGTNKLGAELDVSQEVQHIRRDGLFCSHDCDCNVIIIIQSSVTNNINV